MRRLLLLGLLIVAGGLLLRPLSGSISSARIPVGLDRGGGATVLLLGLDRRESEVARTDTIVLVRIGSPGRPTKLLSIPRDLWVGIPGYGEDRINTAYVWGELRHGDGSALARATVEHSFGVGVDRTVVLDFECFQRAIDAVGGVTLDVPRRIVDAGFPAGGGQVEIEFEPGLQMMSGSRALQYVRTRSPDSDFGRIRRQHEVMTALATRLHEPGPALRIGRAVFGCPGARSDVSVADAVWLAALASTGGEPRFHLLDESLVTPSVLPSGAEVLLPRWDRIRPAVAEIFGGG